MRAPIACLLLALSGWGCARPRTGTEAGIPPGGLLIDEQHIQQSGGHTAWEVLKRTAPMFRTRENRYGQPEGMERRGPSSIYLQDPPVVMIDGVRVSDLKALDQIPANTLFSILVLSGIEGTTYYGTNAVSGVIVIRTKNGP
ncbi:MAG: hypothetical protein DMD55_09535 [Gemmatimonadetes bacterium]|nr:MAG: hypothetical protein DMD55_09535 [Gemmatimonadota bacterium]